MKNNLEPFGANDGDVIVPDLGMALAIVGGNVLDVEAGLSAPSTVLIREGRIAAVGKHLEFDPAEVRIIEGRGLSVLPGLIDSHVHLSDRVSTADSDELKAPHGVALLRVATACTDLLRLGTTTVRALGLAPAEHVYALRQAQLESIAHGPRIFTAGQTLSPTNGPADAVRCDGPDECRRMTRQAFGEGADLISIYVSGHDGLGFGADELAIIVDEARRRGKTVAAHATTLAGARLAVEAGVSTIEHGPPDLDVPLAELMARHGVVLIPTLSAFRGSERDARSASVRLARQAGVRIACGSDLGVSESRDIWTELRALLTAGLSAAEALRAATINGAIALDLAAELGSIGAGKTADLVLIAGDPYTDGGALIQDRVRLVIRSADGLIF